MKKGIFVSLVLLVLVVISACAIRPGSSTQQRSTEQLEALGIAASNSFLVKFDDCVTENCPQEIHEYVSSHGSIPQTTCADGVDNDNDEMIDTTDPDCNQHFFSQQQKGGVFNLNDVSCFDQSCVTVGDSGRIVQTFSYFLGNKITVFSSEDFNAIECLPQTSPSICILGGTGGTLTVFNNGAPSAGPSVSMDPVNSIAIKGGVQVYAGATGVNGKIESPAGTTVDTLPGQEYNVVTHVRQTEATFAAGADGGNIKFSVGGTVWTAGPSFSNDVNDMGCEAIGPGNIRCYVGTNGFIGKIEGGIATEVTTLDENGNPLIANFVALDCGTRIPRDCTAITSTGRVLTTRDGQTWTQKFDAESTINAIETTANRDSVIVGNAGYIATIT